MHDLALRTGQSSGFDCIESLLVKRDGIGRTGANQVRRYGMHPFWNRLYLRHDHFSFRLRVKERSCSRHLPAGLMLQLHDERHQEKSTPRTKLFRILLVTLRLFEQIHCHSAPLALRHGKWREPRGGLK